MKRLFLILLLPSLLVSQARYTKVKVDTIDGSNNGNTFFKDTVKMNVRLDSTYLHKDAAFRTKDNNFSVRETFVGGLRTVDTVFTRTIWGDSSQAGNVSAHSAISLSFPINTGNAVLTSALPDTSGINSVNLIFYQRYSADSATYRIGSEKQSNGIGVGTNDFIINEIDTAGRWIGIMKFQRVSNVNDIIFNYEKSGATTSFGMFRVDSGKVVIWNAASDSVLNAPSEHLTGGLVVGGNATLGGLTVNANASRNIALNDTITSTVGVWNGTVQTTGQISTQPASGGSATFLAKGTGTGAAGLKMDRGGTSTFGLITWLTNGLSNWTFGQRNDATNNLVLRYEPQNLISATIDTTAKLTWGGSIAIKPTPTNPKLTIFSAQASSSTNGISADSSGNFTATGTVNGFTLRQGAAFSDTSQIAKVRWDTAAFTTTGLRVALYRPGMTAAGYAIVNPRITSDATPNASDVQLTPWCKNDSVVVHRIASGTSGLKITIWSKIP